MNIYLVMTLGGLLGIALHSFKTIRAINKRTDSVNFNMVMKTYWKGEWASLSGSIICFMTLLFVASEFVDFNKVDAVDMTESIKDRLLHFRLSNFVKLSSVLGGYFSDSIVYGFLGNTEGRLNKMIEDISKDKEDESGK